MKMKNFVFDNQGQFFFRTIIDSYNLHFPHSSLLIFHRKFEKTTTSSFKISYCSPNIATLPTILYQMSHIVPVLTYQFRDHLLSCQSSFFFCNR